ncbi:hypothetical protein RSAG8_03471, partial [Rhizoctonia solani AG-8 WAC10335]
MADSQYQVVLVSNHELIVHSKLLNFVHRQHLRIEPLWWWGAGNKLTLHLCQRCHRLGPHQLQHLSQGLEGYQVRFWAHIQLDFQAYLDLYLVFRHGMHCLEPGSLFFSL